MSTRRQAVDTTGEPKVDQPVATSDAPDVPTLRELIDQFTDRTGHSRRWIGEHSRISHQTLGYWHAGQIKTFPDPDTLREFARMTGLTEQVVTLAAAKTLGLRVDGVGGLAAALPPTTSQLSDEQVAAIAQLIRVFTAPRETPALIRSLRTVSEGKRERQRLLTEAGAAARHDDEPELSDADGEVHPS